MTDKERKRRKHEYYLAHREEVIERSKQWAKDNPERAKELNLRKSRNYERKNRVKRRLKSKKYYRAHKQESREATKRYYANHPEKFSAYGRKYRYGLLPEQYDAMLKAQKGCCAICKRKMDKPFVDHDHKTEKVRELLCKKCNSFLGLARESKKILEAAIQYLEKHKE